MFLRNSRRCVLALLVGAALVVGATAQPASSSSTDHGGRFHSEQQCVNYILNGGRVFNPTVFVVPFCAPSGAHFQMTVDGGLFHPNSQIEIVMDGTTLPDGSTVAGSVTDDDGFFATTFNITPTTFVTVQVRDEQGVTAS